MVVSSKNGKHFTADFSGFFLSGCKRIYNDAKRRKPNSFITPMTRDMGQNMLPAVKKRKTFCRRFFSDFYLAVSASENDATNRKQNSFFIFWPTSRVMGVIN